MRATVFPGYQVETNITYPNFVKLCNYIFIFAPFTSLFSLFLKAIRPICSQSIQKSPLYTYLDTQSWKRCLTLLIPGSSVAFIVYDYTNGGSKNSKYIIPLSHTIRATPYKVKVGADEYYQKAIKLPAEKRDERFALFNFAAAQKHPDALFELGWCYHKGEGTPKDQKRALEIWKEAAHLGQHIAMLKLADQYILSREATALDESIFWNTKLIENGRLDRYSDLGKCYVLKNNLEEAEKNYLKAAKSEQPYVYYEIGHFYEDNKKDLEKAIPWYELAAENNSWFGLEAIGKCYEEGKGVEKNLKIAFGFYLKGAILGYHNLMTKVGDFYKSGIGIKQNIEQAQRWYDAAARRALLLDNK